MRKLHWTMVLFAAPFVLADAYRSKFGGDHIDDVAMQMGRAIQSSLTTISPP